MQIHRIHSEHHPVSTPDRSHFEHQKSAPERLSVTADTSEMAEFSPLSSASVEITNLLEQMRLLSDPADEALQQAQAQMKSGALFTREAAESVATSSLRELIF